MNSPRCVAANSAGRRFCAECGSPLALACSSCGFSGPDLPERPRRRRWPHRARSVLIGVMLLGFGLSGRSAGSSQDEPSYRHPLDPLTTAEIATAVEILSASGKTTPASRFPLIVLHEPPKEEVLGLDLGRPISRQAFAVVYERASNKTVEAIVDIRARRLLTWNEIPGVQPPILMEEYALTAEIVRSDAGWRAAMAKRGIIDVENVHVEPWPVGELGRSGQPRPRLVAALSYYRATSSNPYARPIEGVVAYADLGARKVVRLLDTGVVPVPRASEDLDEPSVGPLRQALRPLEIRQPDGPSFERHGHQIRWQNWQFRFALHPREGLVLYTVGYEDHGRLRSVLYRASLSELFVPYADPTPGWSFRHAFDEGEIDLGRYANSLEPLNDVPSNAVFVDATFASDQGAAYAVPRALAIYERDGGLLWKHADYPKANESRRARQLVLAWIANQGNYEYGFTWVFHQDGTLEVEVLLTGIVLPKGTGGAGRMRGRHGHLVARHIEGVHHQHWLNFRLDMDVDGRKNSVIEMNAEATPRGRANPTRSAFEIKETGLRREREALRRINLATSRTWKVINPAVRNALGQPVGYMLRPGENAMPLGLPGSSVRRRAGFMDAHLWVTRYDPSERYAAGDYVNQGGGAEGLPKWVRKDRSLENQDIVLWYTMGITHAPRPEDWPVMSVHRGGFRLVPSGFFSRNAALDVPRAK